jgi:pyruvate kinase
LRRTKIVATIGPASREPDTLVKMIEAGMDVARLNFSHGTRREHAETIERIRAAAGRVGRQVAVLQDLPGPKMRIGALREGVADLAHGDRVTFVCGSEEEGDKERMTISWDGLADAMTEGEEIFLADGAVRLRVESASDGEFVGVVESPGTVASRQGSTWWRCRSCAARPTSSWCASARGCR